MAKVRTKKEHKKRVAKRNNILLQEKARMQKVQKAFLMNLIEEEKKKGLFDNQVQMPGDFQPSFELPVVGNIQSTTQQGPII
jgi:hypothetical protein